MAIKVVEICPICTIPSTDLGKHLDTHSEAELGLLLIRLKSMQMLVALKGLRLATPEEEVAFAAEEPVQPGNECSSF